jgi:Flp pilus assembly protein TadB
MLSRDDSRRLAQMERQLWHEDPEFCIRMEAGQPDQAPRKRPPLSLILTAAVIWIAALILGVVGWWAASAAAALCATTVVAVLAYRLARLRRAAAAREATRPPATHPGQELKTPHESDVSKPEDGQPEQFGGGTTHP